MPLSKHKQWASVDTDAFSEAFVTTMHRLTNPPAGNDLVSNVIVAGSWALGGL